MHRWFLIIGICILLLGCGAEEESYLEAKTISEKQKEQLIKNAEKKIKPMELPVEEKKEEEKQEEGANEQVVSLEELEEKYKALLRTVSWEKILDNSWGRLQGYEEDRAQCTDSGLKEMELDMEKQVFSFRCVDEVRGRKSLVESKEADKEEAEEDVQDIEDEIDELEDEIKDIDDNLKNATNSDIEEEFEEEKADKEEDLTDLKNDLEEAKTFLRTAEKELSDAKTMQRKTENFCEEYY